MKEIKDNGIVKFSFYLFGVGGLLAWNTILSIFDFFIHFQGEYQPSFIYTNMNFVLNVVFQFVLLFTKKKVTFKLQILASFGISVLSMIALPISVIFISGFGSFLTTCIIILLQGLSNAVALSCLYSIISFLPFQYIIAFSTGQGIAGILMNITRYLIVLGLGNPDDEKNIITGSIIFFSISAFILVLCIIFVFVVYNNPYFISQMRNSGEFPIERYNSLVSPEDSCLVNDDKKFADFNDADPSKRESKLEEKQSSFKNLMFYLLDINFIIFVSFLFTFAVFPAVAIAQPLFNINESYRVNSIITIFNIFDTIGRKIPEFLPISMNKFYIMAFSRSFFLFSFPLVLTLGNTYWIGVGGLSVLTVINMILFALTNGYIASYSFMIAPNQVPDDLKGKSGSSLSLFLIIGIFLGSLYATIVMQNFV